MGGVGGGAVGRLALDDAQRDALGLRLAREALVARHDEVVALLALRAVVYGQVLVGARLDGCVHALHHQVPVHDA